MWLPTGKFIPTSLGLLYMVYDVFEIIITYKWAYDTLIKDFNNKKGLFFKNKHFIYGYNG